MDYRDSSLPAAERAKSLLALMTTQEKIGQLLQPFGWKTYHKQSGTIQLDESFMKAVNDGGIGSLYGVLRADPWTEVTLGKWIITQGGSNGN